MTVVNLLGSPGAGKTTLLERAIPLLSAELAIGVIEGDLFTDRDARRLGRLGVPVPEEARLLAGPEAPIVLLRKRPGIPLAEGLAPGMRHLGVVLPVEAFALMGGIADAFLLHDRDIVNRCDDSVVRFVAGGLHFIRRSRGYVPAPVAVPAAPGQVQSLGTGGQQKVTFCLLAGGQAVLSQHLGDLETVEAERNYLAALRRLPALTGCRPRAIGCDLHPGYATTRLAPVLPRLLPDACEGAVARRSSTITPTWPVARRTTGWRER